MNCAKCNWPWPAHELREGKCLGCVWGDLLEVRTNVAALRAALLKIAGMVFYNDAEPQFELIQDVAEDALYPKQVDSPAQVTGIEPPLK